MGREISQRELRNESGEILRGVDRGQSFVVTRNGIPVAELVPLRRRRFVSVAAAVAAFAGAAPIDEGRFRADIDGLVDQSVVPRG